MKLQNRLNELRQRSESRLPSTSKAVMQQATDALMQSGILTKVLQEGATAPDFILIDQQGNAVNSRKLIEKGPLVVTFFRGMW
jgi:cytochrome oxidase Cu insertion factor (SCO1/SenC/PrrC family)